MSHLQDEETPVPERYPSYQDNMSAETAWNLYESTHPSIIDKLFSGKLLISFLIN